MNTKTLSAAIAVIAVVGMNAARADQTVQLTNLTRNGAAAATSAPLFVGAGDVLKFDAILTANGAGNPTPGTVGLGLCLEYNLAAVGNPALRNLFPTGLVEGVPDAIAHCGDALGSTRVAGADTAISNGWFDLTNPWPNVTLPLKLYDAQFSLAAAPSGSTRIGLAASAVTTGQQFSTNGVLVLCGKPTVSLSVTGTGSETGSVSATIAIALSAPVPAGCGGADGSFPVTLTLTGTATLPGQPNADYTIGGTRINASGATITASFPADGTTTSLTFAAKPVDDSINEGTETLILTVAAGSGNYGGVGATATASITDNDQTGTVVEYLDTLDFPESPGGHFFYSSDPAEQAAVDGGAAGRFFRTGRTFKIGGTSPVCRFYGSISPGPNSHFFTVNVDECNQLKAIQLTPRPSAIQQWNYERIEYNTTPPVIVNGAAACPAGTVALYRAYNNAFPPTGPKNPWDSNHRFTPLQSDIADMVSKGWRNEGLVFCTAQ